MSKSIIKFLSIFCLTLLFLSSSNEFFDHSMPVIYKIEPKKAFTGDTIKIYGSNLGKDKNDSEVFFGDIACHDYDFDYISWSDNLIIVKVPTGAKESNIKIKMPSDEITGPRFTLKNKESHIYSNPLDTTIQHDIKVSSLSGNIQDPFYLWVPSAVPSDKQRDVSLLKTSQNHLETQNNQLDLYKLRNMVSGEEYLLSKTFNFKNYQLETNINLDNVTDNYDYDSDFYKYYTSSGYAVESDAPEIISLSKAIVKNEKNPYLKAKLIYNWVVNNMDYQYPPPNRDWRAISAVSTHRGDCAVYSFLFTALCHAAGVPARPVAGHVIFINNYVSMHFWAEFYIPKYGWIPVDANYGDVQVSGFMPKEFYFGNLDNRHIAFSKGKVICKMPENFDGIKKEFVLKCLQKYHAYMKSSPKGKKYKIARMIKRVS